MILHFFQKKTLKLCFFLPLIAFLRGLIPVEFDFSCINCTKHCSIEQCISFALFANIFFLIELFFSIVLNLNWAVFGLQLRSFIEFLWKPCKVFRIGNKIFATNYLIKHTYSYLFLGVKTMLGCLIFRLNASS